MKVQEIRKKDKRLTEQLVQVINQGRKSRSQKAKEAHNQRALLQHKWQTAQETQEWATTRIRQPTRTVGPNVIHHVLQNNRDKLKIEVFDGRPGQDLDQWIKDYKMRTRNAGWNDAATKDGIPMYLGGKYKHWFEGKVVHVSDEKKKKYDTSEKVFEMMLEAELHDKENWLKKLKELKQGDAPLNRYLQDLEMICNEINEEMSEQQIVEYAYEGINKELGIRIFEKRPKTLDEMRKYGKEVEAGYRKFMDEKGHELTKMKKLKIWTAPNEREEWDWNSRRRNQKLENCPRKRRNRNERSFENPRRSGGIVSCDRPPAQPLVHGKAGPWSWKTRRRIWRLPPERKSKLERTRQKQIWRQTEQQI